MLTQDQINEIQELVEETTLDTLAPRLHEVPAANLEAIYDMIQADRTAGRYKSEIRYHVAQDVAKLLGGKMEGVILYSQKYLGHEQL